MNSPSQEITQDRERRGDEAETPREARIVRACADVEAPHRIEAVAVHEDHAEAWQRLATPASRRAGRVWTALDVHVEAETLALACEHRLDDVRGRASFCNLRLPRDAEQSVAGIAELTQPRSQSDEIVHIVAGNDDRPVDELRIRAAVTNGTTSTREKPSGGIRRLELAPIPETARRAETPRRPTV